MCSICCCDLRSLGCTVTSLILLDAVAAFRLHSIRTKREDDEEEPPPPSFSIPSDDGPQPYQALGSDNLAPWFPMTHSFANGMSVNKGDNTEVNGHLNVPIPAWNRIWDLNGHFKSGPDNTWWNYGHLLSPANPFHFNPATVAAMGSSPTVNAGRDRAEAVPVIQLPTGYSPLNCKPPMCNPFVHKFDMGFHVEPASFGVLPMDGLLDFPVRMNDGSFRRFPLSGDLNVGQQSPSVVYGHALNNVNPFPRDPKQQSDLMSDSIPSKSAAVNAARRQPQQQSRSTAVSRMEPSSTPALAGSQPFADFVSTDQSRNRLKPMSSTSMPRFEWPDGAGPVHDSVRSVSNHKH